MLAGKGLTELGSFGTGGLDRLSAVRLDLAAHPMGIAR